MTLTAFPSGISSFGVPVIGGTSFGMSTASQVYFVDGTNGLDGNTGKEPSDALKTIYAAINKANAWDVIYIVPKSWTSGGLWLGTAYQDTTDLSIAYAKQGLALIGVGHQSLIGQPYGTVITEVSASTAAILKVHAPMCAFENLSFYNTSTAINGLYLYGDVDGTSEAMLSSVYNCHFHGCVGSGATGDTGGALYSHATWGLTVRECSFLGCRIGISVKSDAGTSGKTIIKDCDFMTRLTTASDISADIYIYTQGSTWVGIRDCNMGHSVPVYTGGHGRFVSIQGDVRQGYVTGCTIGLAADDTTALTHGPAGTGIIAPAKVAMGANYSKGAICTYA